MYTIVMYTSLPHAGFSDTGMSVFVLATMSQSSMNTGVYMCGIWPIALVRIIVFWNIMSHSNWNHSNNLFPGIKLRWLWVVAKYMYLYTFSNVTCTSLSKTYFVTSTIWQLKILFWLRKQDQSHGTSKPLRSLARPRLYPGLPAYIILYNALAEHKRPFRNRSQIALTWLTS